MATPDFVLALRERIGTLPLWISGVTAVVVRDPTDPEHSPVEDTHVDHSPVEDTDREHADGDRARDSHGRRAREVLLVRRSDTGSWTPVTGIIDPGEHPAAAAAREVLEEADIVAVPVRYARVGVTAEITYPNGDRAQYIDNTFLCRYVSGDPYPADGENTDARWFDEGALPTLSADMAERVDAALSDEREARFSL